MANKVYRMFVYGTLKKDEPNHFLMTDPQNGSGKLAGVGKTEVKYPLVIASRYNIPFMLYKAGEGHHIEGEIYDVDEKMLGVLDDLEKHPQLYEREETNISTESGTEKCWCYFLKDFKPSLLELRFLDNYSAFAIPELKYLDTESREDVSDSKIAIDVKHGV